MHTFDFTTYDDAFARYVMFPISAAAYSSKPFECLTNALHFEGVTFMLFKQPISKVTDFRVVISRNHLFQGLHQFSYECQGGQCSGYVAELSKYQAIAIAFR